MKPTPAADETDTVDISSVVDRLKAIDVSSLDMLVSIRQEQKRVDDYRARAEEKKTDVSEIVFKRVLEDYKKRAASLEQQSTPLRAQARTEYKKLKALIDEVKRTEEQTRLQKDELEFRHTVGELSDEHLAEKLKEPVRLLESCQSDQAAVNACKARFVEALGSEDALEIPEPPAAAPVEAAAAKPAAKPPAAKPAPAPAPVAAAPTAPTPIPTPEKTIAAPRKAGDASVSAPPPPPPTPAAAATPPAAPPPSPDQTIVVPPSRSSPAASKVVARPATVDTDAGKTIMLLTAAILTSDPAAGRSEFTLGPLNEIGRAEDNQIQIASSNLSRKHAVIRAVPGGFSITDLGSQNGTFVNGERITERKLADGDAIELGSVRFVFRTPWPVGVASVSAGGSVARQPSGR